jgi:hypothetical protein
MNARMNLIITGFIILAIIGGIVSMVEARLPGMDDKHIGSQITTHDEHDCCHSDETKCDDGKNSCNKCGGSGRCHMCGGSGKYGIDEHTCSTCGGSGRCYYCGGDGNMWN